MKTNENISTFESGLSGLGNSPAMAYYPKLSSATGSGVAVAFKDDSTLNLLGTSVSNDFPYEFSPTYFNNDKILIQNSPALAVFKDKMYLAFKSDDHKNQLWVKSSVDGINYSLNASDNKYMQFRGNPTMAVFKGRLYVAFRSDDHYRTLYITSSADGEIFTNDAKNYPDKIMEGSPSMAVLGNRLYIVYRNENQEVMLTFSEDGLVFSPSQVIPNVQTKIDPSIAEFKFELILSFVNSLTGKIDFASFADLQGDFTFGQKWFNSEFDPISISDYPLFGQSNLLAFEDKMYCYYNRSGQLQISQLLKDLNQKNLDNFKKLFKGDDKMNAVTLEQLQQYAEGKDYNGADAAEDPNYVPETQLAITDCQYQVGVVVYDSICVLSGMVGLVKKVNRALIEAIIGKISPFVSEIEHLVAVIADKGKSNWDRMTATKGIVQLIKSAGMLEAIWMAIAQNLTWWDMVLYGVLGMAELAAAFVTDAALVVIALLVAQVAYFGFLITDAIKAKQVCSTSIAFA